MALRFAKKEKTYGWISSRTHALVLNELLIFVVVIVVHNQTQIIPVQLLRKNNTQQALCVYRKLVSALQRDLSHQLGGNGNQLLCVFHCIDLYAIYVFLLIFSHVTYPFLSFVSSIFTDDRFMVIFYNASVSKV